MDGTPPPSPQLAAAAAESTPSPAGKQTSPRLAPLHLLARRGSGDAAAEDKGEEEPGAAAAARARSSCSNPSASPDSKHLDRELRRKIRAAHRKLDALLTSPRGRKVIDSEKARHNWTDEQVIRKLQESVRQSIMNAYQKQKQDTTVKLQREAAFAAAAAAGGDGDSDASGTAAVAADAPTPTADLRNDGPPRPSISRQQSELPTGEESQFLNAALELMDEQSTTAENMNTLRHEVAQLLEQMEKLNKSLPSSITGCVSKVNEALERCQSCDDYSLGGTEDDGHSVASGWLVKDGGHTLSTDKTRWAIVNPPYMVYYKTVDRSTVKGIIFLDRCRFEPTPTGFSLYAARPGVVLNPLHRDKNAYRFSVPNAADRQWWIETMRSALAKARTVQSILRWQQRFHGFDDIADYKHLIKQCLRAPPAVSPSSSSSSLLSIASGDSSSSSLSPPPATASRHRKSLIRQKSYGSASSLVAAAAAEAEAMDGLTNTWRVDLRWLRNFKNDPILSQQKIFGEIVAPRIRTPRTPRAAAGMSMRVEASEDVTGMVEQICRRFEVSWDHRLRPLGLDSTMKQVRKDTPRDSFCIDGEDYERIQGDELVNILVQKLLAFREESDALAGGAAACRETSHKSAKALRFARSIVLGSTRTISGGDAYDAVDLLFRNRDLVILCPLSGRESRVEIELERFGSGGGAGARGAGSSNDSGGGRGGRGAAAAKRRQSLMTYRSPPRSRLAPSVSRARVGSTASDGGGTSGGSGGGSGGAGADGVDATTLWPRVKVTSRTFYRLRDCAGGDEDVAVAEAIFKRKFLSDGGTNGFISVVLHAADKEIETKPPPATSPVVRGKPRTRQNSVIL